MSDPAGSLFCLYPEMLVVSNRIFASREKREISILSAYKALIMAGLLIGLVVQPMDGLAGSKREEATKTDKRAPTRLTGGAVFVSEGSLTLFGIEVPVVAPTEEDREEEDNNDDE
ncbi:MAG: hypothetical protein AAGE61_01450 [Pseudomonadota bacterium]